MCIYTEPKTIEEKLAEKPKHISTYTYNVVWQMEERFSETKNDFIW